MRNVSTSIETNPARGKPAASQDAVATPRTALNYNAMIRLLLAPPHWAIIRGAFHHDEVCLVGPTGIREGPGGTDFLLRRLESTTPVGVEEALGRWSDVLCIRAAVRPDLAAARRLARELGLERVRRGSLLLLGRGESAGTACGVTFGPSGMNVALDEIVVTGGGPHFRVEPEGDGREKGLNVPERSSRTAGALTERVWAQVSRSRVAIVGCGRSGSVAAELFAREGVRSLDLIDPDLVEEGNLDATLGSGPGDVGRSKVETIAAALRRSHPQLELRPLAQSGFSVEALALLRCADLIVTAVDRDAPRLAAAHLASAYLKPHLDLGTGIFRAGGRTRMGADVRYLAPGCGCVVCVGGLRNEEAARRELLEDGDPVPHEGSPRPWQEERAGSLLVLNLAAVARGVQLWHAALGGRPGASRWVRLEWGEDARERAEDLEAHAGPDCSICAEVGMGDLRLGKAAEVRRRTGKGKPQGLRWRPREAQPLLEASSQERPGEARVDQEWARRSPGELVVTHQGGFKMIWNRVVALRLVDQSQAETWIGTGFLLSEDRVLTARHVVEGLDPDARLQVGAGVKEERPRWHDVRAILWKGDKEVDAAVLELVEPGTAPSVGNQPLELLARNPPAWNMTEPVQWQSRGYPCMKPGNESLRAWFPTHGTLTSAGTSGNCKFLIHVTGSKPSTKDGWRGFSGAPLVLSNGLIYGVIGDVDRSVGGADTLWAVPTSAFYNDPGFQNALGLPVELQLKSTEEQALIGKLETLLAQSDRLARELRKVLQLQLELAPVPALARALLEKSPGKLLPILNQLHLVFGQQRTTTDAALTLELICLLLPYSVWWDMPHQDRREVSEARGAVISLPVATETYVEIVAAHDARRPARFCVAPDTYWPVGPSRLPLPALEGFDTEGQRYLENFVSGVASPWKLFGDGGFDPRNGGHWTVFREFLEYAGSGENPTPVTYYVATRAEGSVGPETIARELPMIRVYGFDRPGASAPPKHEIPVASALRQMVDRGGEGVGTEKS